MRAIPLSVSFGVRRFGKNSITRGSAFKTWKGLRSESRQRRSTRRAVVRACDIRGRLADEISVPTGFLPLCDRCGWWLPTLSPDMEEAGSSTPLRFAQNDRKDGARRLVATERKKL